MAKLLWLVFDMSAAEPEIVTGFSTLEEAERFAETQVDLHDQTTLGVSCEPILCEESNMAKMKAGKGKSLPGKAAAGKSPFAGDPIGRKHAPGQMTAVKSDRGTFQMKANGKPVPKKAPAFGGKGGF